MLKLNSEEMLLHKLSNDSAYRAMFTAILKNIWDIMCRQMAFILMRSEELRIDSSLFQMPHLKKGVY